MPYSRPAMRETRSAADESENKAGTSVEEASHDVAVVFSSDESIERDDLQ